MKVNYVGADVHQAATTLVVVRDGKKIREMLIRTEPEEFLSCVASLNGRVCFAVEQSNLSGWVTEIVEPVVDEFMVCDPTRNNFPDQTNKGDFEDAGGIAELYSAGLLKPVYHGSAVRSELKDLVKGYIRADKMRTNAMNSIRMLFSNRGHWGPKMGSLFVDDAEVRKHWLSVLTTSAAVLRLTNLYAEFDLQTELKKSTRKEMVRTAKLRESAWRSLSSVPGLGDVRVCQVIGIVGTPWRFRTKRQLWKYCGFAVNYRETGEYDEELRRKTRRRTIGLNKNFNRPMKAVFKGAAKSALQHREKYPEITQYHDRRKEAHSEEIADVDVARKLASIALTVWKRQEVYDPAKASW